MAVLTKSGIIQRLQQPGAVPASATAGVSSGKQQPGSVPASGLSAYDWLVAGTDPGLALHHHLKRRYPITQADLVKIQPDIVLHKEV
jgi:hypothetical protein